MKDQRVVTGIFYFLVIAGFLTASIWWPWVIVILTLVVTVLSALEMNHALQKKFQPLSLLSILIGSLTMLAPVFIWMQYKDMSGWHLIKKSSSIINDTWKGNFVWLLSLGITVFLITFTLYAFTNTILKIIRRGPEHFPHAIAESSAAFYIALPFATVVLFQYAIPHGFLWLLYAFVSPMVTDVAAYYSGSFLGRKKMLPKISPNKSWVGFFGGLLANTAFSALYFSVFFRGDAPFLPIDKTLLFGMICGIFVSLASQCGDWHASALKRWVGIKDFSNLLPGHGGILDRFDSIMYSLPSTLFVSILFYLMKRG